METPREDYKRGIEYTIAGLRRLKQMIETTFEGSSALEHEEMIVRTRSLLFQQLGNHLLGNEDVRETDDVIRKTNAQVFDLQQIVKGNPKPTPEDVDDWIDVLEKTPVMTES